MRVKKTPSVYEVVKFFIISLGSIVSFVFVKAIYGAWFLNGFMFALDNALAFVILVIVIFSYVRFAIEVWRLGSTIFYKTPRFVSIIMQIMCCVIAVYVLSECSMIFSLSLIGIFGLDPLQGYNPSGN